MNKVMSERGLVDSSRAITASLVGQFYARNDSALFGSFAVSSHKVRPPPLALSAEDIRRVLKALPLAQRTPLVLAWQSGLEVNRVLGLSWEDVKGIDSGRSPLKLQFHGRKRHRKPYHTYIGRDSVIALKVWREKWRDIQGEEARPTDLVFMGKGGPMCMEWINDSMRETALRLAKGGLVENSDAGSWHSHYLRHSFETEAAHAGVPKEVGGYFEGHVSDISWISNHSDQLHEEDLVKEYLKMEPYVSLEPDKITINNQEG